MTAGKSNKSGKRQCGALPWRMGAGGVEILLVTSRDTKRWVIPKGWPLMGKSLEIAASAEAFEEAGIRGTISGPVIGTYDYGKRVTFGVRVLTVEVFALKVEKELERWPEKRQRQRRWFPAAEAAGLVEEPELGELIRSFQPPA